MNFSSKGTATTVGNINFKCPHCGHYGTFPQILLYIYDSDNSNRFGQVICQNRDCECITFVIVDINNKVIKTYPNLLIDFDKSKIPEKITNVIEEALICHTNECYISAAIMIRKTLEVIAEDKGASGKNLKDRIKDLGGKILIPRELMEGMDELRILGNDSAHVEAKVYEEIGKEEVEISIEFAKEILKSVYQYEDLLNKLKSLKRN